MNSVVVPDVDESEHPVLDRMPAIDADDQIAAMICKAIPHLRSRVVRVEPVSNTPGSPPAENSWPGVESTCRWVGNSTMSITTRPLPSVIKYRQGRRRIRNIASDRVGLCRTKDPVPRHYCVRLKIIDVGVAGQHSTDDASRHHDGDCGPIGQSDASRSPARDSRPAPPARRSRPFEEALSPS